MDFKGFCYDKKSLYNEMKIFQKKQRNHTFTNFKKKRLRGSKKIELSETSERENLIDMVQIDLPSDLLFYHDIYALVRSFDVHIERVKGLVNKRMKIAFESSKSKDKEIENVLDECYQIIKVLNSSLNSISDINDQSLSLKLISNIKNYFQSLLKQKVKKLKKQEQKFFTKIKGLSKDSHASSFDFINQNYIDESNRVIYNEQGERLVLENLENEEQNEDLIKMISTIDNLTKILTHMSEVVVEQGALIDRIDVNIASTQERVKRGNQELAIAKEELEKGCAARILKILIAANLVMFIILMAKFS